MSQCLAQMKEPDYAVIWYCVLETGHDGRHRTDRGVFFDDPGRPT